MKLHTVAIAALAAVFMIASAGVGEAAKKKKAKVAAAPAAPCQFWYVPVCGMQGKAKTTYDNQCLANRAGAKKIKAGRCA